MCIFRALSFFSAARWEIVADACLQRSFQRFHEEGELSLQSLDKEEGADGIVAAAVHIIRADATNGSVWQKCKLHTTEVQTLYSRMQSEHVWQTVCDRRYADLQVLRDSSVPYLRNIIAKQLASCGCPLWTTRSLHHVVRVFLFCTDAGGDISKVRRMILAGVADQPGVLAIDLECFHHQCALIHKHSLKSAQAMMKYLGSSLKYLSSLQKVMNCWREYASLIYFQWKVGSTGHYEDVVVEAGKHAMRMPPRCIEGRWGAKATCEQRLGAILDDGPECWSRFTSTFKLVLDRKARKALKKVAAISKEEDPLELSLGLIMEMDSVGLSEQATYSLTMGRWCRDAVQAVDDRAFKTVLQMCRFGMAPLEHFSASLMSHYKKVNETGFGALAHLVWAGGAAIAGEFDEIMDQSFVRSLVVRIEDIPVDQDLCHGQVYAAFAQLVLGCAAEFNFRVMRKLPSFPYKLLKFVKIPPDMPSTERVELAREVLDTDDLETNTAKIRTLFEASIRRVVASGGKVPSDLFNLLSIVGKHWQCDTQEVEGFNSIVQAAVLNHRMLWSTLFKPTLLSQLLF